MSTPKSSLHSGKSSPESGASKSIAMGQSGSALETPDSSPKPTSPFPKTIDALKSDDDHKTSSGISTPDMTRTSTPETTEKYIDSSETKSSSKKDEISEFTSKVHTQDYGFHSKIDDHFDNSDFQTQSVSSYTTQWSSGYKNTDEDDIAYSTTQEHRQYSYEGNY